MLNQLDRDWWKLMRNLMLFILVWLFVSHSAFADECAEFFSKHDVNLTAELKRMRTLGPEKFRQQSFGRWVEVNGQWIRYAVMGKSGPVRVHFMGLGNDIMRAFRDNLVLHQFVRKGRVVLVELPGQGLTEVHQQYRNRATFKSKPRPIGFSENAELGYLAVKEILRRLDVSEDMVQTWSGSSFGGLNLLGTMARHGMDKKFVQVYAPAVTNYENRFISKKKNQDLESWRKFLDKAFIKLGSAIGVRLTRTFLGLQKIVKPGDKVKLNGAAGQVFGARTVDGVEVVKELPSGSKIQIFIGEKDVVVYPMMHYELSQALEGRGLQVATVMVEGANHNLPKTISEPQQKSINSMAKSQDKFSGYYVLGRDGKLRSMSAKRAETMFKRLSKNAWRLHKKPLSVIFGMLGIKVRYPKTWEVRTESDT